MNSPASGWHRDPTARHEYRYWDGARWTDDVSDRGVTSTDPMPAGGPGGPGSDPTEVIDATQAYPTAPGPAAHGPAARRVRAVRHPAAADRRVRVLWHGGMPPATPQKKGPNTPLLIGLGLLALVAVAWPSCSSPAATTTTERDGRRPAERREPRTPPAR